MADLYGNEAGKGVVLKFGGKGISPGSIVKIGGLDMTGCYVVDFKLFASERFSALPCFGNKTFLWAYGHDVTQSQSSVSVVVFFNSDGCKPGANTGPISRIVNWSNSNRVSQRKKVSVSILRTGKFTGGYLVSLAVNGYSAELNAAGCTLTFVVTDN